MTWRLTEDLEEYADAVLQLLGADPVRHTISLTVVENLRSGPARADSTASLPGEEGRESPDEGRTAAPDSDPAPLFAYWCKADGTVTGAASHTPPYELLLAEMPAGSLGALADALLGAGRAIAGVNGRRSLAEDFATGWQARSGQRATLFRLERLYRLAALAVPHPSPPGRPRVAANADSQLLEAWLRRFHDETRTRAVHPGRAVADRLSYGGLTVWERPDGTPVSLAGRTRPAGGVVRIGPVFTPVEQRGRGYGGAVTAEVSRIAIASNADAVAVVLFTDLGNATTNRLYQRLGYRPVEDRSVIRFHSAGDA